MPNQRNARPVSGEIMTCGPDAVRFCRVPASGFDFVDAEFETLGDIAADKLDGRRHPWPQPLQRSARRAWHGNARKAGD